MKRVLAALAVASIAPASFAGEIYSGVGTDGIAAGYAQSITPLLCARVEGEFLDFSKGISTSNVNYDGKLKNASAGLFLDVFPFRGNFRITAGALIGDRRIDVTANGQSNVTINGKSYNSVGQSLNGSAKFPTVSPYVGIGFGHQATHKGFGFYGDLGVAYGRPNVSLTASPGLLAEAGQANIDAERQQLQNKANNLKFYPVIDVGVKYAF
jgi:hypothetical protein